MGFSFRNIYFTSEALADLSRDSVRFQRENDAVTGGLVVPLRGFLWPDIKAVTSAMNSNEKALIETRLLPVAEVARKLGYRDSRNFRLGVAPRIGLEVVPVGLRWFVAERDLVRVMSSLTAVSREVGS